MWLCIYLQFRNNQNIRNIQKIRYGHRRQNIQNTRLFHCLRNNQNSHYNQNIPIGPMCQIHQNIQNIQKFLSDRNTR